MTLQYYLLHKLEIKKSQTTVGIDSLLVKRLKLEKELVLINKEIKYLLNLL